LYRFFFLFLLLGFHVKAQEPKLVLPIGHTNSIYDLDISPDGKKIISASADNSAKIWDLVSGKMLANLKIHSKIVNLATFSPDGKKIITASDDNTLIFWNASTGEHISTWDKNISSLQSVEFSKDGTRLLTSSLDSTAKIWDVATGKVLVNLNSHLHWLTSARFSPDGKKIVTASWDSTAKVWGSEKGLLLFNLTGQSSPVVLALFSPDGKKILTFQREGKAILWNASTGKRIFELSGKYEWPKTAEFSPDGKVILAATSYSTFVWNAYTGKVLHQLDRPWRGSDCATFNLDGSRIVTGYSDSTAKVWDTKSGKLLITLKGHLSRITKARFDYSGKYVVTASNDNSIKTWDVATGNLLSDTKGHSADVIVARFDTMGKKILTASEDHFVRIWDARNGKILHSRKAHGGLIKSMVISPDQSKVLTAATDKQIKIWETSTGKEVMDIKARIDPDIVTYSKDGKWVAISNGSYIPPVYIMEPATGKTIGSLNWLPTDFKAAAFSRDWKKLAVAYNEESNYTVQIWDPVKGSFETEYVAHDNWINHIEFNSDGSKLVTVANDSTGRIWDSAGKLVATLKGHTHLVGFSQFSPDDKKLVTASWDETAKVWDTESGDLLLDLRGHENRVNTACFSSDGKKIITASQDNTIKIWDAVTGELIYSSMAIDSSNFINLTPKGFYQSSPSAAKLLHYVTKDLKVITFDQLDIKYNRPDKVLEAIGNTDSALIKSYRKAWEKRIKKLGIDTTQFRDGYSVPEADFVNRDSINYEQKTGTLRLHIKGIDSTYKLDRFNVWVNESPLFGQRGISLKTCLPVGREKCNSIDTTITIKLSQGENRIETSITNVNGTESYRMPLYVNYTPAVKQKEMTRFIGIGIDQFKESNYNLQYSSKDIRDLAVKLKEKYKDNIIIDTLFNENVTAEKVKALKEKLQQTTVNDKVIISYSGHGLLSKDYDYYLSTYSVNFNKPEENGLPYDELESLLDSIPARKKLLLIDACHSGEVDKEEGVAMQKMADSLGISAKGIIIDQPQQQHVGLKNSFELMQSLFVNVGKSTGATIISAAAGNQFALERGDLKNGVFTYSILEAMNKYPTIKISELKKIVGERVEQLTNGMQKPTSRNENIAVDWSLW
jgi:WD40 repeat protein